MAMEDANSVNYITKSLYPDIAKKYKTTIGSVEESNPSCGLTLCGSEETNNC